MNGAQFRHPSLVVWYFQTHNIRTRVFAAALGISHQALGNYATGRRRSRGKELAVSCPLHVRLMAAQLTNNELSITAWP